MTTTSTPTIPARKTPVLAIAGSLRKESWNLRLLEAAVDCAPTTMQVRNYPALDDLPMFNEDIDQPGDAGPPAVRALRDAVANASGVLIATPEYNQSIPAVLKNAIDWLSTAQSAGILVGKPIAVIGASSGRWGTRLAQATLRQVLTATECLVMPAPALHVRNAASLFDHAGRLSDPATREQLGRVLEAFGFWLERMSRGQVAA